MATTAPNLPPLYNVQTAAAYCGVTVGCIEYHIYTSGRLQADYKLGRQLIFTESTITAFNARRKSYWKNKDV